MSQTVVGKIDYAYDANGNLTKDLNKDIDTASIGGIQYNHLNLPWKIQVKKEGGAQKGTIEYRYDAAGNKLMKLTKEPGVDTTITDYVSGMVYRNDSLQFMNHEEGRIRWVDSSYVYDYFIKDHLGNTRMVLTDEQKLKPYSAVTLEEGTVGYDSQYYRINPANIVARPAALNNAYVNNNLVVNPNPYVQADAYSEKMYKLGGESTEKTGLGIVLRVMRGDTVSVFGRSYWEQNGSGMNNSSSISVNELLGALAGNPQLMSWKTLSLSTLQGLPFTPDALRNMLDSLPANGTGPKAYINWVLLDEQFRPVPAGSGFDAVSSSGGELKQHYRTIAAVKNGYLYVYCSNQSNQDVLFDNFQVIHHVGPMVEETHYYPFGLTMAGISSKAAGKLENKYKFNGGNELQSGEFSDGSGLEMYDAKYRLYDPQLGRFHQIDALSDISKDMSPYSFGSNNPILRSDPLGLADTVNIKLPDVTVKGVRKLPPKAFYWPSSTASEREVWTQSRNKFNYRMSHGLALSQKGDPLSYTSRLPMYQKWHQVDQEYRAMQMYALGILATPALISISPAAVVAAIRMKLQANLVAAGADFGIQALMNGSQHKSILSNWNPVSSAVAFGVGVPSHSISNIAGVSLVSASITSSVNLSQTAIGNNNIFSFDTRSIIINAAFGTAAGSMGNQLKVDFRNMTLGEGVSQTINLTGATVDTKIKEQ